MQLEKESTKQTKKKIVQGQESQVRCVAGGLYGISTNHQQPPVHRDCTTQFSCHGVL